MHPSQVKTQNAPPAIAARRYSPIAAVRGERWLGSGRGCPLHDEVPVVYPMHDLWACLLHRRRRWPLARGHSLPRCILLLFPFISREPYRLGSRLHHWRRTLAPPRHHLVHHEPSTTQHLRTRFIRRRAARHPGKLGDAWLSLHILTAGQDICTVSSTLASPDLSLWTTPSVLGKSRHSKRRTLMQGAE